MFEYTNNPAKQESMVNFDRPEQYTQDSPYRVFLAMHPLVEVNEKGERVVTPEQAEFHKEMDARYHLAIRNLSTEQPAVYKELTNLHSQFVNTGTLTTEQEQRLEEIVNEL